MYLSKLVHPKKKSQLTQTLLLIVGVHLRHALLNLAVREQAAAESVDHAATGATGASVGAQLGRVFAVVAQRHVGLLVEEAIGRAVGPVAVVVVRVMVVMPVGALVLLLGDEGERVALLEELAAAHVLQVGVRLAELEHERVRVDGVFEVLEHGVEAPVDVHDAVEHLEAVLQVLEVERGRLLLADVLELEEEERARVVRVDLREERLRVLLQDGDELVALVRVDALVQSVH